MEALEFGIGDASTIIGILRNKLYSHPLRTAIQEYISNARDAHREIGVEDVPIEITVPNKEKNLFWFKVRDFGPGISPNRIADVFVKYGGTTKTSDDGQTGGFGIGAKSAWAYTTEFFITTFIGGKEARYCASINDNHNGTLTELGSNPTTEPDGTEIAFKVKDYGDIDSVIMAAIRTTMFWNEPVTFHDLEDNDSYMNDVENFNPSLRKITDHLYISDETLSDLDINRFALVVDGIPFDGHLSRITEMTDLRDKIKMPTWSGHVILKADKDWGIEIAANREGVAENEANQGVLATVATFEQEAIDEFIETEYEKVNSVLDLIEFKDKIKGLKRTGGIKYDNYALISGHFVGAHVKNVIIKRLRPKTDKYGTLGDKRGLLRKHDAENFDVNELQYGHYYYVDPDETSVRINNRVRTILLKENKEEIYLVSPETTTNMSLDSFGAEIVTASPDLVAFQKIITDLQLKKLSDVEPYAKLKAERTKKDPEEISCYHYMNDYDNRKRHTINIKNLRENHTYVYFLHDERDAHEKKVYQIIRFAQRHYLKDEKLSFICLSKPNLKHVENFAEFMHIDDLIQNYTLSHSFYKRQMLSRVVFHDSEFTRTIEKMYKVNPLFLEEISNPNIKLWIKLKEAFNDSNTESVSTIPNILSHLRKKSFELAPKYFQDLFVKLHADFARYTLLSKINLRYDEQISYDIIEDIKNFINMKDAVNSKETK